MHNSAKLHSNTTAVNKEYRAMTLTTSRSHKYVGTTCKCMLCNLLVFDLSDILLLGDFVIDQDVESQFINMSCVL